MFNFSLDKTVKSDVFDSVLKWDVLIIGAGPGGMNAALYAKRKGLVVGILTKETGGQLHNTTAVDNYLGFSLIRGDDLADNFMEHMNSLEIPIKVGVFVESIEKQGNDFFIKTNDLKTLQAKTIVLSTGGAPRKLDIPGEKEFSNRGVTYCATCDGPFFKDKHVVIAGGGNSAAEAVLDMVPFASKISVVHRSKWRADQILLDKLKDISNLNILLETQILEVKGNDFMEEIVVLDKKTNVKSIIKAEGLLVEIGTIPNSQLVKDLVELNERQEVIVDNSQQTSLEGLFAVGDVTNQPYKQIIISAAEGAKAALAINHYINHKYRGE
jgi:thioredoxin-disulfide reductase